MSLRSEKILASHRFDPVSLILFARNIFILLENMEKCFDDSKQQLCRLIHTFIFV